MKALSIHRSSTDTSDPQGNMLSKLKHAFQTYDSASKKYLSAVKDLDNALEGIAVAFRELSQGDIDASVRNQADSLCSAIDAHKSATGESGAPADSEHYYFASYMSDFSQQITTIFSQFKDNVKAAEKSKSKRDDAVKKYQRLRAEVDAIETKLAKKNQGVSDNEKYAEKAAKRDAAKALADAEGEAFSKEYDELMAQRATALSTIVHSMGELTSKYYSGLAKIMRAGVKSE